VIYGERRAVIGKLVTEIQALARGTTVRSVGQHGAPARPAPLRIPGRRITAARGRHETPPGEMSVSRIGADHIIHEVSLTSICAAPCCMSDIGRTM